MESVVSELEGILLKDSDPFSYFMLVAFEASGLIRFALLLMLWPVIRFLEIVGVEDSGFKLMVFVAVGGVAESEIESVARAVLPKFFMDDLDMEAWKVFCSYDKRVVVTRMPRIMVERFVKEHLRADEVIGSELCVNRFGFATGLLKADSFNATHERVARLFNKQAPALGLGSPTASSYSFLHLCKGQMHPPIVVNPKRATWAWPESTKPDPESGRGQLNGHARRPHSRSDAQRLRDAEEFELEGLISDEEDAANLDGSTDAEPESPRHKEGRVRV